jgi:hypothetical protein
MTDPRAICRKWAARLGCGFHPDTRGKDYSPALSRAEIEEYDADMALLFRAAADPYEQGLAALLELTE